MLPDLWEAAMKQVLRWIVLGPLALFWFVMMWALSPAVIFLCWLTADEGEDLSLGSYWGFSTWMFTDLRLYGRAK